MKHFSVLLAAMIMAVVSWLGILPAHADMLVSSYGTNEVKRYSDTGTYLGDFVSTGSGGLSYPIGLVFGPDGNLYVSSAYTNEVNRYNGTTGEFIDTFVTSGSGGLTWPAYLVFGPDGNLYVSSYYSHAVLRYNGTTGAFIDTFASGGGLIFPIGLVFGPDGNLYVSSAYSYSSIYAHDVKRYNGKTGVFMDIFISSGSGGLGFPHGLVFGPDGNLYVSSYLSAEVKRYNGTTGEFIDTFVTSGNGGLGFPHGLVFGPDGNLYVSSYYSHAVLRYNGTTGAFIDTFASGGGLSYPAFLLFTPAIDKSTIDYLNQAITNIKSAIYIGPGKQQNALLDKINTAISAMQATPPDNELAILALNDFYNILCNMKKQGKITQETYNLIYNDYANILKSLGEIPKAGC